MSLPCTNVFFLQQYFVHTVPTYYSTYHWSDPSPNTDQNIYYGFDSKMRIQGILQLPQASRKNVFKFCSFHELFHFMFIKICWLVVLRVYLALFRPKSLGSTILVF